MIWMKLKLTYTFSNFDEIQGLLAMIKSFKFALNDNYERNRNIFLWCQNFCCIRLESAASTYMVCDLDVMILIIIPG